MCNDIGKEFRGWCKSFTRTEALLAILEAVLLAACIGFAIFLTLHFIACEKRRKEELTEPVGYSTTNTPMEYSITNTPVGFSATNTHVGYNTTSTTSPPRMTTETDGNETSTSITTTATETTRWTTLPPHVSCTWEPSHKTGAVTHYYADEAGHRTTELGTTRWTTLPPHVKCTWEPSNKTVAVTQYYEDEAEHRTSEFGTTKPARQSTGGAAHFTDHDSVDDLAADDQAEGVESEHMYKSMILALVKMVPPAGVTFGCTLTAISDRWTLTAASCVEAAEEVDSLDSFVMMEHYGGDARGRSHALADVRLHPRFEGAGRGADLAALRSEDRLGGAAAHLPAPLDRWLVALGERFTVLGFGSYRTIEKSTYGRSVREVRVYAVAAQQCAPGAGLAERHLSGGRALAERPPPEARALCAGVLRARAAPCTYCAGTPLLRRATLLAVMAAGDHCAVACEPALYGDVAAARPWLDGFVDS